MRFLAEALLLFAAAAAGAVAFFVFVESLPTPVIRCTAEIFQQYGTPQKPKIRVLHLTGQGQFAKGHFTCTITKEQHNEQI
jgi:hypothetical protein